MRSRRETFFRGILPVIALAAMMSSSCQSPNHPEGLAKSGGGFGPMIWFDPLSKPVPEIPFPNDLATIFDPTMVTGRRINITTQAPTEVERDMRRVLNTFDGFGTFSALSVRFTAPVDLNTINENNVLIIKLDGAMAGYAVPIDFGKGFFPTEWNPDSPWWKFDKLEDANNIMMKPDNMADLDGDTIPDFVDFYEFETNTMVMRPLYPLEEASRYAVVLLKGLAGIDGQPVRSPFEYINHTMQTNDLTPLVPILAAKGLSIDQVAFCWSFTTQSISPEWVNLWNGIYYGAGPLAYINAYFPPNMTLTNLEIPEDGDGNPYTLDAAWFGPILKVVAGLIGEDDYVKIADFRYIDYFSYGYFDSPSFFTSLDFGNPLFAPSRYFDQAKLGGLVPVDRLKATWMLTVPKSEDMGLDGCQNIKHPHGCKDIEEPNAVVKLGPDSQPGQAGVDDDGDTTVDNIEEYLALGSDDVAGAAGPDNGFGYAGIDDNGDGKIDDSGEYMTPGSDDIEDPACDNFYANTVDYPLHCPCVIGVTPPNYLTGECSLTQGNNQMDIDYGDGGPGDVGIDDDRNGIIDDISEYGLDALGNGVDDGLSEDANHDGSFNVPPFPVAFYGHGHTSSRIESIGFAGPMAQTGIALFGFDNFGHGPMVEFGHLDKVLIDFLIGQGQDPYEMCTDLNSQPNCGMVFVVMQLIGADLNHDLVVDANDIEGKTVADTITEVFNLAFFQVLGTEGRGYDTDIPPDGVPDSGDIFWTANILQTRDLVRQTAIDWMQFVRIVDNFGKHASNYDLDGDTIPELEGDFNGDGVIDLGGDPATVNTRGHFYFGSSLGGMLGVLNMGVNPRMIVGAPVSGAGGMPDVVPRSHQRSATVPILLQMCGPLVIGDASNGGDPVDGRVTLYWNQDGNAKAFGYLYVPKVSQLGRKALVQVQNMTNGETRVGEVDIETDGGFAIGVPASINDTIVITSLDDVSGIAPSSVVVNSKYKGHGLLRNSPDIRRFIALAQWAIERGDAINVASHYFTHTRDGYTYTPWPGYPEKGVLVINTTGDSNVPINTGNSIATAAGLWSLDEAQWLIDKGINMGYVPMGGYYSPIFDAEDLDDDGLKCGFSSNSTPLIPDPRCTDDPPFAMPLAPRPSGSSGMISAIRWPYVRDTGTHAFSLPGDINHGIDWGVFMSNMMGYYFASDGTCIIDDPWELGAAQMIKPGLNGILDSVAGGDTQPGTAGVDDDGDTIVDNASEYGMGDDTLNGDDKVRTIRVFSTLGLNDCSYPFPVIPVVTTGRDFLFSTPSGGDDILFQFVDMIRGP